MIVTGRHSGDACWSERHVARAIVMLAIAPTAARDANFGNDCDLAAVLGDTYTGKLSHIIFQKADLSEACMPPIALLKSP